MLRHYNSLIFFIFIASTSCKEQKQSHANEQEFEPISISFQNERAEYEPIKPIHFIDSDPNKVALGKLLFHDNSITKNGKSSCASCHNLKKGGADYTAISKGVDTTDGVLNTPSVYNAVFNFRQFWDGQASDLTEAVHDTVSLTKNAGISWTKAIWVINHDGQYTEMFQHLYNGDISKKTITDAIVGYEKTLVTPSRFDRFLLGDEEAISKQERKGYQLFKEYGCGSCHQGVNIGGNMYQKLGIVRDYFKDHDTIKKVDWGRFNITQKQSDKFSFKVPSLRNVSLTAPYLHNGEVQTLKQAIQVMAVYQIGRNIPDNEINDIEAFLQSLTGEELEKHNQ
ncbi:cytochrome c peroxidase [Limibacter armeniacum]|uniref:cytochrome-c peroxidase n=1 Tax=Limibacter armeniacum TaxID=466084 RepID=UPI002FE69F14